MLPAGRLEAKLPGYRSASQWVHYTTSCNTQSSSPEDGRDQRPKHVELNGINKSLLLRLVGVYIISIELSSLNSVTNFNISVIFTSVSFLSLNLLIEKGSDQ